MNKQPNILLITTDQQHHKMMSCAGNPYLQTPNLDRIAQKGTRFNRCYVANPVCIPSRFSLYTGHMPSEIGMWANQKPSGEMRNEIESNGLGHLLTRAGYMACFAGKEHLPLTNSKKLGFTYLVRDEREAGARTSADFLAKEHEAPFFLAVNLINPHDICYMGIRDFAETDLSHAILRKGEEELRCLDEALAQLEQGATEIPPLPENHKPQVREPEALRKLLALRPFRVHCREEWDEQRWREHLWAYARLTERVDAEIGIILDALDKSPNADNTVVIFTSDHGDHNSSHKLEHKTIPYEEADHVPLITYVPGQSNGGVLSDILVNNGIDLVPTICELAGAETPVELQGRSFAPAIYGDEANCGHESVYTQTGMAESVVFDHYKYWMCFEGEDAEQLFDLQKDPGMRRDYALEADYAEALEKGRRELAKWRARFQAEPPHTVQG
jgi:choline-sulfatase